MEIGQVYAVMESLNAPLGTHSRNLLRLDSVIDKYLTKNNIYYLRDKGLLDHISASEHQYLVSRSKSLVADVVKSSNLETQIEGLEEELNIIQSKSKGLLNSIIYLILTPKNIRDEEREKMDSLRNDLFKLKFDYAKVKDAENEHKELDSKLSSYFKIKNGYVSLTEAGRVVLDNFSRNKSKIGILMDEDIKEWEQLLNPDFNFIDLYIFDGAEKKEKNP